MDTAAHKPAAMDSPMLLPEPQSVEDITHEHEQIRAMLAELDEIIARPKHEPHLHELVDELAVLLRSHFVHEEDSDLYTRLPRRFPRMAIPLAQLRDEHRSLLTLVEGLDTAWEQWRNAHAVFIQRARALIGQLRTHEAAETELLQRAYTEDIGTAD